MLNEGHFFFDHELNHESQYESSYDLCEKLVDLFASSEHSGDGSMLDVHKFHRYTIYHDRYL